jgi:hypothetical protein
MAAHLVERGRSFKALGSVRGEGLTGKNRTGTLFTSRERCPLVGTKRVWTGSALQARTDAMIAALGTLAFLATLWLLVVLGAAMIEESGDRIAAALEGGFASAPRVHVSAARVRTRARIAPVMRARPRWRDAA